MISNNSRGRPLQAAKKGKKGEQQTVQAIRSQADPTQTKPKAKRKRIQTLPHAHTYPTHSLKHIHTQPNIHKPTLAHSILAISIRLETASVSCQKWKWHAKNVNRLWMCPAAAAMMRLSRWYVDVAHAIPSWHYPRIRAAVTRRVHRIAFWL